MGNFTTQWEKTRKKGRLKYALTQGVIFGIIVTLIKDRTIIWNLIQGNEADISIPLINFLWVFIAATIGYYFLIWWWKEKLYKKEKATLSS